MTQKKFLLGVAIVLGLLAAGLSVLFLQKMLVPDETPTAPEAPAEVSTETGPPAFEWEFEDDDTLSPDGVPNTALFLTATYSDGETVRKEIDVTHGSCNSLPENETDSVPGTRDIQCYAAGLGYRYKVVEETGSYLILRQTFEEAMPGYEPPDYQYETIAEFPRTAGR